MRVLVFFLILLAFTTGNSQQAEPLIFKEKIHDFGELRETSGNANHEFTFQNNAGRPVRILSVQASCGCTTPDWSKEPVLQGKSGFVKVSFDPRGKPGYFNKTLTVTTDLDGSAIVLQIKGQVLTNLKKAETSYTVQSGHLRLKTTSFNLGRIFINKDPSLSEFEIYNEGDQAIRFLETAAPFYLQVEAPATLQPGEKSKVRIAYNATSKNQYGFVSDNIEFLTDDDELPRKSFSVYATIEEYFPILSSQELAKAPVLSLEYTTVDLGRTRSDNPLSANVKLKNTGKKELQIRTIQSNCTCLNIQNKKTTIKSNEEIELSVTFTSQGRKGTHQKAITIYSNDPRNPVQRITFTAYIED
jgi:hypothetical protein